MEVVSLGTFDQPNMINHLAADLSSWWSGASWGATELWSTLCKS